MVEDVKWLLLILEASRVLAVICLLICLVITWVYVKLFYNLCTFLYACYLYENAYLK